MFTPPRSLWTEPFNSTPALNRTMCRVVNIYACSFGLSTGWEIKVEKVWPSISHSKLDIHLGTVSLKLLGGKLAPKLVYVTLEKELLSLIVKWHPETRFSPGYWFITAFMRKLAPKLVYVVLEKELLSLIVTWHPGLTTIATFLVFSTD